MEKQFAGISAHDKASTGFRGNLAEVWTAMAKSGPEPGGHIGLSEKSQMVSEKKIRWKFQWKSRYVSAVNLGTPVL